MGKERLRNLNKIEVLVINKLYIGFCYMIDVVLEISKGNNELVNK